MKTRFVISVVAMFIVSMVFGFVVHGLLLGPDYARIPGLFRSEQEQAHYFPSMILAHVFMAVAFVWIYLKGRENKPSLMQGIRYGAAIAALMTIPTYLIYYAVQPMPGIVVVKQIVFDTIMMLVMGVVVAWLNAGPGARTT